MTASLFDSTGAAAPRGCTLLEALTLILICQLAGEVTVRAAGLPVPGPVLGMLLLLAWLWLRGGISERLGQTADSLLGNLSLLFVPAGVGVMVHWARVQEQWVAIAAALLFGTLITLAVTALTMMGVQRLLAWRRGTGHD
ncbi:CidA/LrgA family protein [uncultured Thiodictyon sp.]|uniref:CidA/LrgA family protein n=1 Tax=uncultured Thiodictyon sp. TaxID=1846217 RepID=UPI0025FDAB2D|nr:CidA/LrgA family protein [uncultured Thiodictyon sp.]